MNNSEKNEGVSKLPACESLQGFSVCSATVLGLLSQLQDQSNIGN